MDNVKKHAVYSLTFNQRSTKYEGLIYKLIKIGLPAYVVVWINEFLANRKFKIKLNSHISNTYSITCGVPQGAVLSPLLFSIFINDVPLYLNRKSKHSLLFADDLMFMQIFRKINSQVENQLNKQMLSLESWLNNWRLKMAPEKCVYSIFSNNKKAGEKGKKGFNNEKLNLMLYNQAIQLDNDITFLGLRFDKYLTFKNQINYLKKQGYNRLNIIKVLSHKQWKIDQNTLTQIYKTLVRSLFDYSLFIFPLLSNKNKRSLQNIQDCALRIIYKKRYDCEMLPLHNLAEIETLDARSKKLISNYFTSASANSNPIVEDLLEEFEKFQENFKNENIITLLDFI